MNVKDVSDAQVQQHTDMTLSFIYIALCFEGRRHTFLLVSFFILAIEQNGRLVYCQRNAL